LSKQLGTYTLANELIDLGAVPGLATHGRKVLTLVDTLRNFAIFFHRGGAERCAGLLICDRTPCKGEFLLVELLRIGAGLFAGRGHPEAVSRWSARSEARTYDLYTGEDGRIVAAASGDSD